MYVLASLLLNLAVTAQSAPAAAAEAPALPTHEDLWLARRIGPPVLSPDGRLLLLTVTEPAYDPAQTVVDLWLLPTDGKQSARRLTASKAPEANAVFAPDSTRIAFSAQREGDAVPQIYQLDLIQGGEAQRITQAPGGARLPQYAPDGESILFISSVYAGVLNAAEQKQAASERAARKHNVRVYTGFPVRNWDKWLDDRQLRVFVQRLDGSPERDLLAGSQLVQQAGYGGRFTDTAEELDAVWAPDGQSIVFAATRNRDMGAYGFTHSNLYQVSLKGGEPKQLTPGDGIAAADSYSKPRFAPDGRTLYALLEPHSDRVYNASRLVGLRWPGAVEQQRYTLPDARSITSYAISGDSRSVYVLGEDAGQEVLWQSPVRKPKLRPLARQEAGVYTNLSAGGVGAQSVLAVNFDAAHRLAEVVLLDPATGAQRSISGFNQERQRRLTLAPVEHFWSESPAGKKIHSLLVRPANFDPKRKYPLFVMLHGGPHGQWRDSLGLRWNYHLIAGDEYVLLLTNFSGSTGFGEAFAQSIQGDPFKGPADEINDAASELIARFDFIDGKRQCAGGASYGGHLANWMQATTTHYQCLISHAGLVNLESQWGSSDTVYSREVNMGGPHWERQAFWDAQNPIRFAANFRTPTLVTIGELDYRVPVNNSLEYWSALQRQRVPSRLLVFPDENHWILKGENSRYFYQEIDQWLDGWLRPELGTAE